MRRTSEFGWLLYDPPIRLLAAIGFLMFVLFTLPRTLGRGLSTLDPFVLAILGVAIAGAVGSALARRDIARVAVPAAAGLVAVAIAGLAIAGPVGSVVADMCATEGGCLVQGLGLSGISRGPVFLAWLLTGVANGGSFLVGWIAWRYARRAFGIRPAPTVEHHDDPVMSAVARRAARRQHYRESVVGDATHQGGQGNPRRRPPLD